MIRAVLACVMLTIAADRAMANAARVSLRIEACGAAPAAIVEQQDARVWQVFKPYLQLCAVMRPDGDHALALSVLIVRMDWADEAGLYYQMPGQSPRVTPHPVIYDANWHVVGTLPKAFPTGVPGETRVVFTNWDNGWPHRVEIRKIDAAALGTYDVPPLVWNARKHAYEPTRP